MNTPPAAGAASPLLLRLLRCQTAVAVAVAAETRHPTHCHTEVVQAETTQPSDELIQIAAFSYKGNIVQTVTLLCYLTKKVCSFGLNLHLRLRIRFLTDANAGQHFFSQRVLESNQPLHSFLGPRANNNTPHGFTSERFRQLTLCQSCSISDRVEKDNTGAAAECLKSRQIFGFADLAFHACVYLSCVTLRRTWIIASNREILTTAASAERFSDKTSDSGSPWIDMWPYSLKLVFSGAARRSGCKHDPLMSFLHFTFLQSILGKTHFFANNTQIRSRQLRAQLQNMLRVCCARYTCT